MLNSAHQGYIYQDILGAYFVAQELAVGKKTTKFHFDYKKTSDGIPDKFDDLTIYREGSTSFIQIKYSNDVHRHVLTKQDFSSSSNYDLALFDLFETWKALHREGYIWRICLAWDMPLPDDAIRSVLIQLPDSESLIPGTSCFKFNCDVLWPKHGDVLPSWRALRKWSNTNNRNDFEAFLDCLVIEVNCPKSTLLQDYSKQLERLLARTIEEIGVGIYPNDHLKVQQVAESLCTIVKRRRATNNNKPISCDEIAKEINIKQNYGGIEQIFPIDKNILVDTPDRIDQVISALEDHHTVILTAEPGAGKSWFIENLQNHLEETTQVIKHYCYTALDDPLILDRITINVLYGSLITQILKENEELGSYLPKRYASNLGQLNILLGKISERTLLIVDGIDHIWRVYQKNGGGLTEDETRIVEALSKLDCTNPNVYLLIVSQPIDQLKVLSNFYHCTLTPLPEGFVQELLERHAINNIMVEDKSLSQVIHEKSNGNALYCKYLIDHAVVNKTLNSFEWIDSLPSYDFNLSGYYEYLFEQIDDAASVPHALCGADFSLTEKDLEEITHLGSIVSKQLNSLRPILKYIPALGYSIYHESFKRFVVEKIKSQGASINDLIYYPIIVWLEKHTFFKSIKAFGHLLKLYFEVDNYAAIAQTISEDFIEKSLFNAQPFHNIKQNHYLQKAILHYVDDFTPMIIIAEQAKIIYELEHNINDQVLISYLKAIQQIHGNDAMYRVLWDEEHLLVDTKDALLFLAQQAYQGKEDVHWSIIPHLESIPYDILGLVSVKLIHMGQYEEFDNLVKSVYENPKHKEAFAGILDEVEWLCLYRGDDWLRETPYFNKIITRSDPSVSTLGEAIEQILSSDRFIYDDHWKSLIQDVVILTRSASDEEIKEAIHVLSNYNWFRNWIIFLIKITVLSQKKFSGKSVIDAFSYLVRDLEPFKGEPRACDLFKQLPYIKKSFHQGLLLCKGNSELLIQCCELLEKVTNLTTGIQRSFSGPLTEEEYLKLITFYLPGEYVVNEYAKHYNPLGSRRIYSDVAEIAFNYAYALSIAGQSDEAKKKYIDGIQALTAYGFRKDRTLSEVIDCCVLYHQTYKTLDVEWFYELYKMAMTVVTHTDGKSTNHYPIEWFEEFIKVYPDEALKFLVSETIENSAANWYQEEEFYYVLQEYASLFNPTQWFLLCRSLPLAASNEILANGLEFLDQIDSRLKDTFSRWLQTRPNIHTNNDEETYTKETISQYETKLEISLKNKKENITENTSGFDEYSPSSPFPITSGDEALAFLESNAFKEGHVQRFQQLLLLIRDMEEKKKILRQAAMSFWREHEVGTWVNNLFNPQSYEWLYFNICLFVFITDGWYHGLYHTDYLKRAYKVDPSETINILKEVLGYYLSSDSYHNLVSCNLINALSEIKVEETVAKDILQTIYQIVKRRLPHPPNSEINMSLYQGLNGLNRDEMVVALLIARLKTLTTEKNQGVIWSLVFVAQTTPKDLFKPYLWAFSHTEFLLPIHRAVLLQILKDYIDQSLIPDELIGQLLKNYPTGFFLEDQYIRSFIEYRTELDESSANFIQFTAHQYDEGFFTYIHPKYRTLNEHLGPLRGTYKAYVYRRDKISKEQDSYYIQTKGVFTPIVSNANAVYEIVNGQYYGKLKQLTNIYQQPYICNLSFRLEEIILQVGALSRRPSYLPSPEELHSLVVRDSSNPYGNDNWIIVAVRERELYGEDYKPAKSRTTELVLTTNKSTNDDNLYARYLFNVEQYKKENLNKALFDQPICELTIYDMLERSSIIYVSPFVVKGLGLRIDYFLHNGFQSCNDKGEVIIKTITWKEEYYGEIAIGTEVPRFEGTAVMVRDDYYEQILALYSKRCGFVLKTYNKSDHK